MINASPWPDNFCLRNPYYANTMSIKYIDKKIFECSLSMHLREEGKMRKIKLSLCHLYTSDNIPWPLINCIIDLHIIDGAKKCIWLQNKFTR